MTDRGASHVVRPLTRRTFLALAGAAPLAIGGAAAADFPSKTIRIVVPYPAGGSVDALARILAQEMQAAKGWTVVVENKAGASGAVGTREVARAEPDGHTLVLGTNQTHATNAFLMKEPGYDPVADFAPVAGLADLQHALVVPKASKAASVAELIAAAKAAPGTLNYGSTGNGSASHLAMELFKSKAGIDMQHVPFRGAAPLSLELVAGRIDAAFVTLPSVVSLVQAGDVKALAIASPSKARQLPAVPLLSQAGIAGGEADAWIALFAPARTPAAAMAALEAAAAGAMGKPAIVELATAQGIAVNVRPGAAFKAFQREEIARWAAVARSVKLAPE
ncbi:MAG: tripartite tricarboxylate transporter substrate-binding protein [Hyphomicrobiaceae bacterium]|nr:tripartite tricarboxylate transporter substrate-binding protein [Hyphomicrobiaceae bacterium]